MQSLTIPPLPTFGHAALLLDVDGTLLDFAPTPEAVVVPPGLTAALSRLKSLLGGALGVISGRPVEQVEALLGDAVQAVAGEHGGAIRRAPGAALERLPLASAPSAWIDEGARLAAAHPGARLERKQRGFVVHYRAAPAAGPALHAALLDLVARDPSFALLAANMAWEVRPRGADKGLALTMLMQSDPFAGRVPVFIGDDVTDHDAIRAAQAMEGAGLLVANTFGEPAHVRAWLKRVAEHGGWA
jgi:trehalose 6-phosphate phosphatase